MNVIETRIQDFLNNYGIAQVEDYPDSYTCIKFNNKIYYVFQYIQFLDDEERLIIKILNALYNYEIQTRRLIRSV